MPELEANALGGTSGVSISRIYQNADKGATGGELEAKEIPGTRRVVSNATLTDIQIKEIESQNSRLTNLAVLSVILDPDFRKTYKWRTGTELEANAIACISGDSISMIYQSHNKGNR